MSATQNSIEAVMSTEASLICVGTPCKDNGSLDTSSLEKVTICIGEALKLKSENHTLIFRSTMLPGTIRSLVIPLIEKYSGKKANKDFHIAYNPEFLRESSAVKDFFNPPKTVVGADLGSTQKYIFDIYKYLPGPQIGTDIEIAEMIKYADNNFHAVKIAFANEIGRICKKMSIDSRRIMDIFTKDTVLNISPVYLKPGFAFGGSCLPKDLRALNYLTKTMDVETPLLNSVLNSNTIHINDALKKIISFGKMKIGIAGFSFKAGTDDLRESPVIEVIETLIGKGYELRLYDRNVFLAGIMGSNKEYLQIHIPHITSLMTDSLDELLCKSELIIIGNNDKEFESILEKAQENQIILDLVGIGDINESKCRYEGICW